MDLIWVYRAAIILGLALVVFTREALGENSIVLGIVTLAFLAFVAFAPIKTDGLR